ncbi:hypothetical protein A4D02_16235 [Niastella koreensis]|uniref:Uncharacterized protein n=1 Tax=Niastella koreensis TaxID=354356 RepID=A0ABX3NPG2_9BACT|nr:hypothetical protein A4D02_16235 [Niastella koreensis]
MFERVNCGAVGNQQVTGAILNQYPGAVKLRFYYHTQAISVKKSGVSALLFLVFWNRQFVIA